MYAVRKRNCHAVSSIVAIAATYVLTATTKALVVRFSLASLSLYNFQVTRAKNQETTVVLLKKFRAYRWNE